MSSPRAIVVVTEGASPDLLETWGRQGLLPNFTMLGAAGAHGSMTAEVVPYEPPGLVSAFTGHAARSHGWLSYWTVHERDYRPRVRTSASPGAPFLWHRDELRSCTFAVVNVFGTHPPRSVNGFMVSYPMQQTLRACFPSELPQWLGRRGIRLRHDVSAWYSGQSRDSFLGRVLEADLQRGAMADAFLGEDADVVIVNLTGIDRTSHFYWQELEPGSRVPAGDQAILRAYQVCDGVLGSLLRWVDERTSLLAFSEIGFGPLRAYYSVNDVLRAAGLLACLEPGDGAEEIVWPETIAFEAVQGTHGVNLNLEGRQEAGAVSRMDYEKVRSEVGAVLEVAVNPHTGLRLFDRVRPGAEVYPGCGQAPDLIVDPADQRFLPLGDPHWARHVNRRLQSGWHRARSYWAGVGPAFPLGGSGDASPPDVAATVFRMLDRDVPEDVTGVPLTELPR